MRSFERCDGEKIVLGRPIPAAALAAIDELGRPRIASLLSALAREPRDLLPLLRLSACFRAALASLQRAAEIAGSISRGE